MKTLELKRPGTGTPPAGVRAHDARSAHRGEATGQPLYVSWGDHPQRMQPVGLTEPCIPCCTTL